MNDLDKEIIVSKFQDKVRGDHGLELYLAHMTFIMGSLVFFDLFKLHGLINIFVTLGLWFILIGFETRITKRIFKKEWIKISKEIAKHNPYKVGVKILEPNESCFKETKKEYTIKNINMDCQKVLLTDGIKCKKCGYESNKSMKIYNFSLTV